MAETPELTKAIDEAAKLHAELASKQTALEERLQKDVKGVYDRIGLDADKEEKHNLLEMAGQIADLDVAVQKMRRTRSEGGSPIGVIDAKDLPKNPVARALHLATSTAKYGEALDVLLRKSARDIGPDDPSFGVISFREIPDQKALGISDEVKSALATDFGPGAGFLAPPTMEQVIDKVLLESSPLARHARTVTIGSSLYTGLIRNANRDTISNVGERDTTRPAATQLNRYDEVTIPVYESMANPALTQTMIEDSMIDLATEIQADAAEDFGVDEGRQFIKGTGVKEAEGIAVNANVAEKNSGAAATFDMDAVKSLPQELKVPYKANASYALSREALTTIILMRTDSGAGAGTGPYMWQPSTQDGTPSRLNGYAWWEAVDLDAVAANAYPIFFGDFNRGYRIVRRRGLRILRDEYTQNPYVVFKMSKRFGGKVWMPEAIVKMKIAA